MRFLKRTWTDAEKWAMGIASTLVIAGLLAIPQLLGGNVTLDIASKRDRFGRCIDAELLLRNGTKHDATEITIPIIVDYFTESGAVEVEYGDEHEMLMPPAQSSLIPREPYVPVAHTMDRQASVLTIPRLQPGQYIHIFFGGETVLEEERASARKGLLTARQANLMDKPRVGDAHRKDGTVKMHRVVACPP